MSALLAALALASIASGAVIEVAPGIDPAPWDRLLHRYVDERGLIDYAAWRAHDGDRQALAGYLALVAAPAPSPATGADRAATLVNAYNALVVSWVLENPQVSSILATDEPFRAARHRVGGRAVSLDAIEHEGLRPGIGYRVHAALVCGARSCPPLAREAYRATTLDTQLDAAMARWLAREDLNRIDATGLQLSKLFEWYAADFEAAGGVRAIVQKHGPPAARQIPADVRVGHLEYDWSLNIQPR